MRYQILMVLFACAFLSGQTANPDEWPIPGNIGHTGFSATTVLKPPFELKWATHVAGLHVGESGNGLVVAGGKVLIQGTGNYLFCLDAQTGEQLWRTRVPELGLSDYTSPQWKFYPGIALDRVYAVFGLKGMPEATGMRCFDLNTGELLWKKYAGLCTRWLIRESPQVSKGKVFLHSVVDVNRSTTAQNNYKWQAQVQAWDALTGDSLWTYTMCDSVHMNQSQLQYGIQVPFALTSLCVIGDSIFASFFSTPNGGGRVGKTVALNLNGDTLWSSHLCAGWGGLAYHGDKLLLSGLSTDTTLCLNPRNGDSLWATSIGFNYYYPVAIMNNRLWTRSYYGIGRSHSMVNGQYVNTVALPSDMGSEGCSPMRAANGYVYTITGGGAAELGVWNEAGALVSRFPMFKQTCSDVAIAYDQIYAVGQLNGMVYCLKNAQ